VLRHESLLHDIIEGRMRGKATRGWKRMHLLSELVKNRRLRTEQAGASSLLVTAED